MDYEKFGDVIPNLTDDSQRTLGMLYLYKSDARMDVLHLGFLKAFYATVVSIDRNEKCRRSWTDYHKLKEGYDLSGRSAAAAPPPPLKKN